MGVSRASRRYLEGFLWLAVGLAVIGLFGVLVTVIPDRPLFPQDVRVVGDVVIESGGQRFTLSCGGWLTGSFVETYPGMTTERFLCLRVNEGQEVEFYSRLTWQRFTMYVPKTGILYFYEDLVGQWSAEDWGDLIFLVADDLDVYVYQSKGWMGNYVCGVGGVEGLYNPVKAPCERVYVSGGGFNVSTRTFLNVIGFGVGIIFMIAAVRRLLWIRL